MIQASWASIQASGNAPSAGLVFCSTQIADCWRIQTGIQPVAQNAGLC
jgi:hypothetical protein